MTGMPPRPMQHNSGNMLIYIIGAIFLMGILMVVIKGNTQEGTGIDIERAALKVTEVQKFAAAVERGVQRIIENGYSEAEIRFAHPDANASYGVITSIPERQVFDPMGGDIEYRLPPSGIQSAATPVGFSGQTEIAGVGTTCAAARCADLTAYIPNVSRAFCLRINDVNAITNPAGVPPVDTNGFNWNTAYTGTFPAPSTLSTTGSYTFGKFEGCVDVSGTYYYYRVLLAR